MGEWDRTRQVERRCVPGKSPLWAHGAKSWGLYYHPQAGLGGGLLPIGVGGGGGQPFPGTPPPPAAGKGASGGLRQPTTETGAGCWKRAHIRSRRVGNGKEISGPGQSTAQELLLPGLRGTEQPPPSPGSTCGGLVVCHMLLHCPASTCAHAVHTHSTRSQRDPRPTHHSDRGVTGMALCGPCLPGALNLAGDTSARLPGGHCKEMWALKGKDVIL